MSAASEVLAEAVRLEELREFYRVRVILAGPSDGSSSPARVEARNSARDAAQRCFDLADHLVIEHAALVDATRAWQSPRG